jgi:hypothetical protein
MGDLDEVGAFAERAGRAIGGDDLAWAGDPAAVEALLGLAADAAHGITRPAAPMATFLAGLALGRAGADPDGLEVAIAQVRATLPPAG